MREQTGTEADSCETPTSQDFAAGTGRLMRATWEGETIAESNQTIVVEGNHYFPETSVNKNKLSGSDTKTICGWKGVASYYSISAGGKINKDAAWYYAEPKDAAREIKGRIAFWKGVEVKAV